MSLFYAYCSYPYHKKEKKKDNNKTNRKRHKCSGCSHAKEDIAGLCLLLISVSELLKSQIQNY